MAEKLFAKFTGKLNQDGTPAEFVNGVPARSFSESEFAALTDEQKAAVHASPLYDLRHDAPAEAEQAHAAIAPADAEAPVSTGSVTVPPMQPAPEPEPEAPAPKGKR